MTGELGLQNPTDPVGVLIPQPFENPFGGMSLFAMNLSIVLENFFDDRQEWIQLRFAGFAASITGRFEVSQNLRECLPVNPVFLARGSFADFAAKNTTTNLGSFLHVCKHPCLLPRFGWNFSEKEKFDRFSAKDHLGATFFFEFVTEAR